MNGNQEDPKNYASMQTDETGDPFTVEEIEDCKIIIKARGLHWSLLPSKRREITREDARDYRVALAKLALMVHEIVDCPLEDHKRIQKQLDNKRKS